MSKFQGNSMGVNSLISIVIPSHNSEAFLSQSLDSVKAQTYRPIQVIVVDDGSTDNTHEIAVSWGKANAEDSFKVSVYTQENAGAASARNKGLALASGVFTCFLDSDDIFHPQFCEILCGVLIQNLGLSFVICRLGLFYEEAPDIRYFPVEDVCPVALKYKFGHSYWSTPNVLYRTSVIRSVDGWSDELVHGWQDRELCLRLLLHEYNHNTIQLPLVYYRQVGTNRLSQIARSKSSAYYFSISKASYKLAKIAVKKNRYIEASWAVKARFKWLLIGVYQKLNRK